MTSISDNTVGNVTNDVSDVVDNSVSDLVDNATDLSVSDFVDVNDILGDVGGWVDVSGIFED